MTMLGEVPCPDSGRRAALVGARPRGLIYQCPVHDRVWTVGHNGSLRLTLEPGAGFADPEERLWFIELALRTFIEKARHRDYVIFESLGSGGCNYVQFLKHDDVLYAEVGSHEWDDDCGGPLDEEAVARLRELGFEGGGPDSNYVRDGLGVDNVAMLARLAEGLFFAAYEEPYDFEPFVVFSRTDMLQAFLFEKARSLHVIQEPPA